MHAPFSSIGMAKAALEAIGGFNLFGKRHGASWSTIMVSKLGINTACNECFGKFFTPEKFSFIFLLNDLLLTRLTLMHTTVTERFQKPCYRVNRLLGELTLQHSFPFHSPPLHLVTEPTKLPTNYIIKRKGKLSVVYQA